MQLHKHSWFHELFFLAFLELHELIQELIKNWDSSSNITKNMAVLFFPFVWYQFSYTLVKPVALCGGCSSKHKGYKRSSFSIRNSRSRLCFLLSLIFEQEFIDWGFKVGWVIRTSINILSFLNITQLRQHPVLPHLLLLCPLDAAY